MNHPFGLSLLALAVGLGAGAVVGWSELREDDPALVSSSGVRVPGATRPGSLDREPIARVKIEGEKSDYNFGTMQRGETKSHIFVFKNVGDAPLTLIQGKVSCVCTISKLGKDSLQPGESVDVTLEWTPKTYAPDFRQTAEIMTNDPERQVITLAISGNVTQAVRPIPEDLSLSRVTVSEPQTYSFKVFSYLAGDLELTKMKIEPEKDGAFITLAQEPLTAEELAAEKDAKSGKKVVVTLKPGLALGPLHSTVHIETNQKDIPPVEVPIRGTVISDISLAPRSGLDLEENIFRWGPVSGTDGKSATLYVTVKGKDADKIKLTVGEVDPADALQVTLGEPKLAGEVRIYPLVLTVPPGTGSVNRLGGTTTPFGKIVIQTTHPTAPQLIFYVRFAVE